MSDNLKITAVTPHHVDGFLLVTVDTDAGVSGVGESAAVGVLASSLAAVEMCAGYLVGRDPLARQHNQDAIYKARCFLDAGLMGALSAIDLACADIAGRLYGAPIHRLLGGPTRRRARVYRHVKGYSAAELEDDIGDAIDQGYTAVGHLILPHDAGRQDPYDPVSFSQLVEDTVTAAARIRDLFGWRVDLLWEGHRMYNQAQAVTLARELAPFRLSWMEDPVPPDDEAALAYLARYSPIPIATGERLHRPQDFARLITRGLVAFVRPNLGLVGGYTGAAKIAAVAEAHGVQVAPHQPGLSPVLTAHNTHYAASIPNLALVEYPGDEHHDPKGSIVDEPIAYDGQGYLTVPTAPGLGVTFDPDAAACIPPRHRQINPPLARDGSVLIR